MELTFSCLDAMVFGVLNSVLEISPDVGTLHFLQQGIKELYARLFKKLLDSPLVLKMDSKEGGCNVTRLGKLRLALYQR